MWPKQNDILVTGGAGFIGSELVHQLAARGFRVTVIDNLVNGRRENLGGLREDLVHLEVADIRDAERMGRLLRGVSVVFHLACLGVRHSIHAPRENHEVNATATLDLLERARSAGVPRFVYVSTSEVYGTALTVPMNEHHPTFPMTVYGSSKLAGECYARAYHRTYRYETVIVRPFNTYGPRSHHEGDSGEVIPRLLLRCMAGEPMIIFGDGTQTRDFTHVTDMAAGIMAVGLSDDSVGRTVNLGNGSETSINDLADEISAVVGRNAGVEYHAARPGDVMRHYADVSAAQELIGFEPKVGLRTGLANLRDWFSAQGRSLQQWLEEIWVKNWIPHGAE